MKRFDRIQAILTLLQSKRIVKAEELAERFETSVRTIYRDIRSLEAGGIPIGSEAGIGYFLLEGYKIPPIMFTKQEAQSLLLGGKLIEKIADESVNKPFQEAMDKVKAVIDFDKKENLEELNEQIMIHPFPLFANQESKDLQLEAVKRALSDSKVLEFTYHSNYKGETTARQVEPIGICYYGNRWHLIAYCLLRKDYRDFRLDRMEVITVLSQSYKKHELKSLKLYVSELIAQTDLFDVVIRIKKEHLQYMSDAKHNMGLVHEEVFGDEVKMTFAVFSLEYFGRWLISYGNTISVIEPQELKEKMKALVNELLEHLR